MLASSRDIESIACSTVLFDETVLNDTVLEFFSAPLFSFLLKRLELARDEIRLRVGISFNVLGYVCAGKGLT